MGIKMNYDLVHFIVGGGGTDLLSHFPYLYLPAPALFSPAPAPYKLGDSKHIVVRE